MLTFWIARRGALMTASDVEGQFKSARTLVWVGLC
jgi:hypothetical protein